MRLVILFALLVACAPVVAADLQIPGMTMTLKADYGLVPLRLHPSDLGLNEKQALRVDLATRFDEALLQLAAQGLYNCSAPLIWLDNKPVGWDHGEETWRGYYTETHKISFVPLGADFPAFLQRILKPCRGIIVYDQDVRTDQVFLALNIANVNSLLPVSRRILHEHRDAFRGLRIFGRIPRDALTRPKIYNWMIENILPLTDRTAAMSVRTFPGALEGGPYQSLDYAFYRKCFIFDLAATDQITDADAALVNEILTRLRRPAYIFGWGENEFEFCKRVSVHGHSMCATVSAPNISFHARVKPLGKLPFRQDLTPRVDKPEKKIYIAFVANEGDTATTITQLYYRGWLQPGRGKCAMSWAINPAWAQIMPAAVEYLYQTKTPEDYFVCAPSATGYMYPQYMAQDYLNDQLDNTARLLRECIVLKDFNLWQGDTRPALQAYADRLPGIRGLTLDHDVAANTVLHSSRDGRVIPVIGFGGLQQYWITQPQFIGDYEAVKIEGVKDYLDSLYNPEQLPRFVPFYGLLSNVVNGVAELSGILDPAKYEIVDLGTVFHLASQVATPSSDEISTPAASGKVWDKSMVRDINAWTDHLNNPIVEVTEHGLRIEIPDDTTWALVAVRDLKLPPGAKKLRVRVSELHTDEGGWLMKCYSDFAGVGWMSHWLPVGFQTRALEADIPLTPQILGALDSPMHQFQIGLVGKPHDYVIFDVIDFTQ